MSSPAPAQITSALGVPTSRSLRGVPERVQRTRVSAPAGCNQTTPAASAARYTPARTTAWRAVAVTRLPHSYPVLEPRRSRVLSRRREDVDTQQPTRPLER